MKKLKFLLLPLSMLAFSQQKNISVVTENSECYQIINKNGFVRIYNKPKIFDFITKTPKNFININKNFMIEDHPYYLISAIAGTLAFVPIDQKLTNNSRVLADKLGMNKDNNYKTIGGFVKLPKDIGSGLYLLGYYIA